MVVTKTSHEEKLSREESADRLQTLAEELRSVEVDLEWNLDE